MVRCGGAALKARVGSVLRHTRGATPGQSQTCSFRCVFFSNCTKAQQAGANARGWQRVTSLWWSAYAAFDKGLPNKFVIDPHGLIQKAA
jgi:hypothetical protein